MRSSILFAVPLIATLACRSEPQEYNLEAEALAEICNEDEFAGNSTPDTATVVKTDQNSRDWNGADLFLCRGDQDWYAIDLLAGQRVEIDLAFVQQEGDLQLELVADDGRQMALASSITDNEYISWTAVTSGTYRIRIYGAEATTDNDYALNISVTGDPCKADSLEPNDGSYSATTVLDGEVYDKLSICFGDRDWFAVSADNGEVISASIDFVHDDNDMGLQLYKLNDDGSLQYRAGSDTLSDGETIIYQPFETGTFVFQAYPSRGTVQVADYTFSVETSGDSCVEDQFEPNNAHPEAVPVAPDSYSSMTLCVGDDDWYTFDVANGETVNASISFDHAENDLGLQVWVRNPDGTITWRSGSDTLTDDENIIYQPFESGTYLLRVYRSRGTTTATYDLDLAVEGESCAEDAFEPNNAWPEAVAISEGSYTDTSLCVGDDDWYELQVSNGQVLTVSATFEHDDNDLGIAVYQLNDNGTITWRSGSDTLTDNETVNYLPFEDGTFLVRIYRSRGTTLADYDLDVSLGGSACAADAYEPNNAQPEAQDITAGSYDDLTLCVGDADWYSMALSNGQTVTVDLDFIHADNDLGMALYRDNADGTYTWVRGSDTLTDGEEFVYQPIDNADYLLYVYRSRGTVVADYDLAIDITGGACVEDATEPNNAYAEAAPIVAGTYDDMNLCVGDADWFSVDLSNGQILDLSLAFDHADNDLGVQVYKQNDDGTISYRTGSDTLTDNETIVYQPFETGTFLIYVYRSRGTTLASYDMALSIGGASCIEDGSEPNNATTQGAPITPGSYTGSLCVADVDWYEVDVDNGQLLDLQLSFTHADNDLGMRVYKKNDDGTVSYRTGSDTLTDDEAILYQPYDSGTFLVQVYRSRGTTVAPFYQLSVDVVGTACVEDAYEPNNAFQEASTITAGSYQGVSLCVGDADWYEFTLGNGQVLAADITFTHADNDLGMTVYKKNDDGTISARIGSNTLTDNESIVYQPYDSGTFLLYVYRTRGTQVADYDLDLTITGSPCIADGYEPNDQAAEAVPIVNGTYAGQTLCVGDADWYSIDVVNGQLVDIGLNFVHADNDLGVALYKLNADGTTVYRAGSNTLTDNERILYTPYEDGTFLVYVYRTRGTTVAGYQMDINVSGSGCTPDLQEPNNAYAEATAIATGTYPNQSLCVGDDDWYQITASNGQLITFSATFTHADNDLGIQLYRLNANGTITYLSGSDTLSDNEFIIYRPYDPGTNNPYLVRVYRSRGTTTAAYGMTIDVQGNSCAPDVFEPNDHWLQASSGFTTGVLHTGLSVCVSDIDYNSLGVLSQGDIVNAQSFFSHATGDLGMNLYAINPDGTASSVSSSDSLSDNEALVYTVPAEHDGKEFQIRMYLTRGTQVHPSYDIQVDIN